MSVTSPSPGATADAPPGARRRGAARAWLVRALLAAGAVAFAAAAIVSVRDDYFRNGLTRMGAFGLARALVHAAPACVPAALLLAALAELGRRRQAHALVLIAALAAALLGYAFASFRLPFDYHYVPTWHGARGLAANGVAALAGLAAAGVLAVPGLPRRAGLAAALVVAGFACAAGVRVARPETGAEARWPERPNLILISIDTLRADRLGCYGDDRGTTPTLDRFAERALRFERAFCHHPWTLTSHMTMMTGLPPTVHGVDEDHGLPGAIPTLAERLSAAGWATVGVTDRVPWLDDKYGFARGFDLYRRILNDASLKIDRILTHVDNLDQRPFFLFAHFYDVHSDWGGLPYVSGPADEERFAGWYDGDFDGCVEGLGCASDWMKAVDDRGLPVDEDVVAYVSSLYDAGLATFDRELGRLFDALEERGVLDRSVVLVLSDHGEEFREHGKFLHGQRYDECLRVPFLLRTPDTVGGSSDELVCMVDVAPTLLELAGLPPLGLGRSVAGAVLGRGVDPVPSAPGQPTEAPVVVLDDGNGIHGLRGERWAVMRAATGWEVYDLAADPGQENDLAQEGRVPDGLPAEVHELVRRVQRERERLVALGELVSDERPSATLTPDERARLRALGYLGE